MEERRIQLHPYLDAEIIEAVYRAVGVKAGGARKAVKGKGMNVCMYVCMYVCKAVRSLLWIYQCGFIDLDEDIDDDEEVDEVNQL